MDKRMDCRQSNCSYVFINPVKDILHIQTSSKAIISLTNQSGQILLTKTIDGRGEINISNLPAGYFQIHQ